MKIDERALANFRDFIWSHYRNNGRTFPWREYFTPYNVVVSEIMLQQTQTYRVEPKYKDFIKKFPGFSALSQASLHDVLANWQGLGYNRRGKYLHQVAQKIVSEYEGLLPCDETILEGFPGIGPATARSICAFAFNKPTVFIETNIRSVFIYSFFKKEEAIADKDIMPLIAATVDRKNPREWYYALMDYGVYLKKLIPNPSRKSKHHTVQTKFAGSDREIRGAIIRLLSQYKTLSKEILMEKLQKEPSRVEHMLTQLAAESLIKNSNNEYSIY